MHKELKEKLEIAKKESNECKDQRNELNSSASTHSTKRNELNKQAKELIEIAQRHKHERDDHNKEVRELKKQRDELNEQTNVVLAKFDALQKEHNIGGDQSLPSIKAEVDALEYRQMTQVLTPEQEKDLVKTITTLSAQYNKQKAKIDGNAEIKGLMEESDTLRDKASEYHEKVTVAAELAQSSHDNMLEAFKKSDAIRAESDVEHRKFIVAQEEADKHHQQYIKLQKEIRELDRVLRDSSKDSRAGKRYLERAEINKSAEDLLARFKEGGKLSNEDFLILQRSNLL
ncbi:MAG: phosphoserine phosphatase [Methanosarcinales archaeon]|nr:phosphoserine phosphatase [Methanosarcinales archaeon]